MEHVFIVDINDIGYKNYEDNHRYRVSRKYENYYKEYKFILNGYFNMYWDGEIYRVTKDYVYIYIY